MKLLFKTRYASLDELMKFLNSTTYERRRIDLTQFNWLKQLLK